MIEEGLQFMTLQLALVDKSTNVDMLRTTSFSLAFFWVNQSGSLCSGACLSLFQCCFEMVFQ